MADGKFSARTACDGIPDDGVMTLEAADLPDGGFGFEYCCGRSFVVDNVQLTRNDPTSGGDAPAEQLKQLRERQEESWLPRSRRRKSAAGTSPAASPG